MAPAPDAPVRAGAPSAENGAARVQRLHESRAVAEIAAAEAVWPGADAVAWSGSLVPAVALIKGLPGPAETSGGAALSGADGEAAHKALESLGYDPRLVFAALSRPDTDATLEMRRARLLLLVEAVDPPLVIALDAEAAQDLSAAYGDVSLGFGKVVRAGGRRLLAIDGLEASLTDPARKRRVWNQLKAAAPPGPVY